MYFYVRFTYALCQVCVNSYVMLSGYFMVNSSFRLKKLAALWMEAVLYGFGLKLLFMLTGNEAFSVVSLASCFFPILTGRYWFLTIYVGMYLVAPFVNILIHSMDRKQHGMLNLCLFAIMSVWSSIHPSVKGMNSGGGWGLAWFVVLYLAAAWFRLYYVPAKKAAGWLACYVAVPLLIAGVQCMSGNLPGAVGAIVSNWFRYDAAPVYVMSVCLFVGFLNIEIRNETLTKWITAVSPLTFGVYLIHAHANVSPWSWEVLALPEKMGSAMFPLIQLGAVFGIFAVCACVDALRKCTVGRLEDAKMIRRLTESVSAWTEHKLDVFLQGEVR